MHGSNPYQAPSVTDISAIPAENGELIEGGRSVSAGRGGAWIAGAWRLYSQAPLMWTLNFVIMLVASGLLGAIPFVGFFVQTIVTPMLTAGILLAARAQHKGNGIELAHTIAGFQKNVDSLALLGLLNALIWFVLFIVFVVLAGVLLGIGGIGAAFLSSGDDNALIKLLSGAGVGLIILGLVFLGFSVPIAMAFWFAPALVALRDMKPLDAIRMSFSGCMRNVMPYLIWGIVAMVIAVVGIIPLGLGLLIVLPLLWISIYTAWSDIYLGDEV